MLNEENYQQLFRQYEHEISLMKSPEEKDLSYYPPEYKYFIENNKLDALDFYRHYLMEIIGLSNDSNNYIKELTKFLNNEVGTLDPYFLNFIKNNNFLSKLLKRRNVAYNHYATHPEGENPLSSNMLQNYTKAYENEELLIIWKYFSDKINSKKCDLTLNNYRQGGRILKGKLITSISNELVNYPKMKSIFDLSYHKTLRNSVDHNNVFIDDNKEKIKSIDNDKILMSKDEFAKVLYALQTLHNMTLRFITLATFDYISVKNEGVIDAFSVNDGDMSTLYLLQLKPFFQNDKKLKADIKEIFIKIEGKHLIFKTNIKEIIRLEISYQLLFWYMEIKNRTVQLIASMPIVEKQKNNYFPLITPKGEFLLDNRHSYIINIKRIK